ncbi:Protein Mei2 [Forsythia ovata]|uniref:Protein Mei2 n=1 Tax=Forsythia ovata TaxID=205694 RepID=A0ABD1TT84_9LAMI
MPIPILPLLPSARGLIFDRVVWALFTYPVTSDLPNGNNQGTIVIFNLDPQVSTVNLKKNFEAFAWIFLLIASHKNKYRLKCASKLNKSIHLINAPRRTNIKEMAEAQELNSNILYQLCR